MRRFIAFFLALTMLFSLVSCGKKTPAVDIVEDDAEQKVEEVIVDKAEDDVEVKAEDPVEEKAPLAAETDRETLEKIADMVGIDDKEDVSSMDDDTLEDYIYSELDKEVADLTPSQDAVAGDNPAVDSTGKEEYYEEDGSMNRPFDVIYPELVANGEVEYAEDALLLKISNSQGATVTPGMQSAGVAKLESVVPMSEYTWYKASLVKGTDISAAVTELRSLSEIETVDYDYVVEATAMDEYKELPSQFNANQTDRWELHHCGVPDAYKELKSPGGSSSVIVAVIDTGVDYNHEDLKQNIWVNSAETPDNGIDDDRNGYVDDYYGVDIVAKSGNGNDDHGHGTHVAGIIAAQNNNLGIVGLAYNCKIMPIKAGNHSGYFLQSDIAKAVLYAYDNGAEVINMSFGGTACSQAVQDALMTAYARCVLVASAGNDGAPNEPVPGYPCIPNYPAALSYVVGVMSVGKNGFESSFSNWDVEAFNGVEYEVYAPGEQIISTIPGNSYAAWSGTSMAAPYVSAIAAILRSEYADRDKYPTKFIYGQICSTSEDTAICLDPETHGVHNLPMIINLHDALTKLPKPNLGVTDYAYFDTVGMEQDTAGKNTGDGVVDAGETIALGLTLRNQWGMSENTMVKIDTHSSAGLSDPYIEILNDTVNYGSVGTYATQDCGRIYTDEIITGWENPFYIKIADNCPNDYIVNLNVTITAENGLDEKDNATYTFSGTVSFTVRNGVVLPSVIDEDMTLTPENLYIIANGVLINEGVTVTAMPGTHIQFWTSDANDPYADKYIAKMTVDGIFRAEGTEDSPVYIYPSELYIDYAVNIYTGENGYAVFNHVDATNLMNSGARSSYTYAKNSTFRMNCPGEYLNDRELRSGKVYTNKYSGLYVEITEADSCVFYKLAGQSQLYLPIGTNCAYVDCSGIYRDAHDCLLLGNSYKGSGSRTTINENIELSCEKVLYRPETGTTYVVVKKINTMYNSTDRAKIEKRMATMGAARVKFESQEEWAWLKSQLSEVNGRLPTGYDIGIYYNCFDEKNVWAVDGTDVGDWFDLGITSPLYSYNYHPYNDSFATYDVGRSTPNFIYEIPGEVYVTDISFANYSVVMDTENTFALNPITLPGQVPADKLLYESKDETVATVDENGVITPVGKGTTQIYVYSDDKAVYNHVDVTVGDYAGENGAVIYNTEVDETVERHYWTAEGIAAEVEEQTAMQSINAAFIGNAILNRISTETDVEKWLQICHPGGRYGTVPLGENYWGTTNEKAIELQMIDGRDFTDYGLFDYTPYLTTPPELVFPYVTDVTILDKNGEEVTRVGSEEITVRVNFSRDMNTEQPVEVAFGSSEPYRDYIIEGGFVEGSKRVWEGTYTVSTVIGNGYQYFSIGGGEADNGKDLYTDWYRFAFEIDTTAAQAMIMQGNAIAEGITLTWMQDDFDTLMGYNVYRSTALDGQYQRLNSSVIPAETKTFFDDTVEPGKQYFYNFTVVKTDLTESEPSGKITIWSLDTMAPNIYHSVVASATMGSNLMITATVTDNLRLETVKLMYRTTGTEEYKMATMSNNNDKYSAIIPAEALSTDGLEYYIDAFDGINHTYRGSAETPYSVTVLEPTTVNDLGDVDGNGVINLLDALMVLKAKNHKLNLDAAQFARADLDGNTTLEAWEALRILQYASGTVGSVLP